MKARLLLVVFVLAIIVSLVQSAVEQDDRALVKVWLESKVGLLLDDIPEQLKASVVQKYTTISSSFWEDRAKRHYRYTWYYMEWRMYFQPEKSQIVFTPEDTWIIHLLDNKPTREVISSDGIDHEYLTMRYKFLTYILTDTHSLNVSEPALGEVGGTWTDDLTLPLDPDHILQRTGYSCMDEAEFPPNSVDTVNAYSFFDFTVTVEPKPEPNDTYMYYFHYTHWPNTTCREELADKVGFIDVAYNFERIPWNDAIADAFRRGEVATDTKGGDLQVLQKELNSNRIEYRYFDSKSCALVEKCIKKTGWRRILKFTAATLNVGSSPMHVGDVTDEYATVMSAHNVYEWSECHKHMHFQFYANYSITEEDGTRLGNKQAWCLESINRIYNHENVTINSPYHKCRYQGVSVGWSDEYSAGIECQWIDITTDTPQTRGRYTHLGFEVNPKGFLCEGFPVLNENGTYLFEPSPYFTQIRQLPMDKPKCDYRPNYEKNNAAETYYYIPPAGSFINEACAYEQLGHMRDCGWGSLGIIKCVPGETVSVKATVDIHESRRSNAQVLRICNYSHKLKTGVACSYVDALGHGFVYDQASISFTCPTKLDDDEPGGIVSVYNAPYLSSGVKQDITIEQLIDQGLPSNARIVSPSLLMSFILAMVIALLCVN